MTPFEIGYDKNRLVCSASMGKAKLLGFLSEQPAVELKFNYATTTEQELMSEIANIHEQARAIKKGQFIDH